MGVGNDRGALPEHEWMSGWLVCVTPEHRARDRSTSPAWESWSGWPVYCTPEARVIAPSDPELDREAAALRVRARRMEALGDPFHVPWPATWPEESGLSVSDLPWSSRVTIVQAAKRAVELGFVVKVERWQSTVNGETWRFWASWPHGPSGQYPIVFAARTIERELQVAGVATDRSVRWLKSVTELGETLAAIGRYRPSL